MTVLWCPLLSSDTLQRQSSMKLVRLIFNIPLKCDCFIVIVVSNCVVLEPSGIDRKVRSVPGFVFPTVFARELVQKLDWAPSTIFYEGGTGANEASSSKYHPRSSKHTLQLGHVLIAILSKETSLQTWCNHLRKKIYDWRWWKHHLPSISCFSQNKGITKAPVLAP